MIKAYAAPSAGQPLEPFEYDPGELGDSQVEIAVEYCGICHSDLSMINNEWGFSQYPLVPGHEVVGKVAAVGSSVQGFEVGQRVGLGWHSGYCNHCEHCDDGDHNLCFDAAATIVARHGGFADKVRADATAVVPLPDGVSASTAGPLFCGGITVFNPMVQFGLKPTDKVAVIGIGGLGHMALKFLNAWGCEVTAFTSSEHKRKEALVLGAHHTLNSRDAAEIESATNRFDMIISTVNVKLDWNLYLSTLRARGRLHLVGVTLDPLDLQAFGILGRQLQISGSPVGSPSTISKMLDFAALHQIEPQCEMFPMSQVNDAIAHLESGKANYRIVLVND
ncbi:NADPH-dependent aldehyde reductase Ahr [Paraferrimonas sedimenticola]|uniref:alcohol dehydrogenase (NADP(+)) n=1 Tax=Paraferrimonas sedimenticola TaxID=375674 RepID=A0AA37W0S4_9GAMM|nr:NAD(P)-dependent alcohol dehydrogenase [Paraferrimonas sedimenticola]GLP95472.1 alcohol dehydrogenase [Paraferrimonas sedimenticola]